MTDRIIDVGSRPARLSVRHEQIVVDVEGQAAATVPLDDVAVVVLSSLTVTISASVLDGLARRGATLVVSGRDHLPAAMLLPLLTHSVQSERHGKQAELSQPRRKRLWQAIVQAKLRQQASTLESLGRTEPGLRALAQRVRSGDPNNLEAQGARRYWPLVFDDPRFRRGSDYGGRNAWLNYGYATLRAGTARALCAAGLHPSLGLQHHNRYDPFCLASDLMEPFRPLVDLHLARLEEATPRRCEQPLDPGGKAQLLEFWSRRYLWKAEERSLSDLLFRTAQSLAGVIGGEVDRIEFPSIGVSEEGGEARKPPQSMTAAAATAHSQVAGAS